MAGKERIKIILIAGLGVLLIILLYVYFSASNSDNTIEDQKPVPFTRDKMQHDLDSILFSFGIQKEWIKEIAYKEKDLKGRFNNNQEMFISKEVRIPADLLTIDLNYEITNYLKINDLENKVTEDPRTKNIEMKMLSFKDSLESLTGNLKFIYSDSLKRKAADICIILDSLDEYNLEDVENILNSTQQYSVFLPVSNDKADYQSKIIELKKDYLLKFSLGDREDIEADFKEDMKESFWKSKIRAVGLNFPGVTGIVLISRVRNPELYSRIKEEFIKNNLNVYPDSMFSVFKNNGSNVISLFDDIISETKNGKKYLFYDINFNPGEFDIYDGQVHVMKKLGYRFYNFKSMINLGQKNDSVSIMK